LIKEVKHRTNVVGVFPDKASVIRLVGPVRKEQTDDWQLARRYSSLESMQKLYDPQLSIMTEPVLFLWLLCINIIELYRIHTMAIYTIDKDANQSKTNGAK
jgi:hypothetical protein